MKKQNEARKRVVELLEEGRTIKQIMQILSSLQEWESYEHAWNMQLQNEQNEQNEQTERREALQQLEEELIQVKASLYGLAGFGLPEGPLKQLKQSITDCINQTWRLKEGGAYKFQIVAERVKK